MIDKGPANDALNRRATYLAIWRSAKLLDVERGECWDGQPTVTVRNQASEANSAFRPYGVGK